ncbi:MAG: D-alanyl-D-alanine carboxypeptidase/D-alanyl-D-alanine endopeptidase [Planctomycetota bacterium]|jgi:D-alanyl-D-alanine carboxypeptidase/D-alanyl-D-alanine-endopeptidase (penicillin-binding protein 4)
MRIFQENINKIICPNEKPIYDKLYNSSQSHIFIDPVEKLIEKTNLFAIIVCQMKSKIKKILIFVAFTACLSNIAKADLAKRVNAIVSNPSLKKVQFSIHIIRARSGRAVYSHNAREPLVPASNMKIITSATALKFLGAKYTYKTIVGLCDDTLVIIGSGDPLLGDKDTDAKYNRKTGWIFEDITAALKRKRIKYVNNIIIDSGIFDDQRVHPSWPKKELNKPYACEVSGLNFNDNCIDISAKIIGKRAAVYIEPKTAFIKFTNKVTPISKGISTIGSYRNSRPNEIIIHGKCKSTIGPYAVAIERPAAFFGFLLAESLAKAGINTKGQLIEKAIADDCKVTILTEYNTPIADCLARCNKDSFGLAAEALVKTVAANSSITGKNGSWAVGRQIISQYLSGLGIDRNQFYIADGSGLSRQNELSAYAITRVLSDVYKGRDWDLYKASLAVGGVDGTISRYFKEQKYKGKVVGKTGYIAGVKALSGICTTPAGDYLFSILANKANGTTRTAINNIAKAIIDDVD